jgi:hypothetical protein
MRRSIPIALAMLTGMTSAWAQNESHALKPRGHLGVAATRHAESACAINFDGRDRSAFEAGDVTGLITLLGELKRQAACQRAHPGLVSARHSPSAREIDDAANAAAQESLLSEQWRREESN